MVFCLCVIREVVDEGSNNVHDGSVAQLGELQNWQSAAMKLKLKLKLKNDINHSA